MSRVEGWVKSLQTLVAAHMHQFTVTSRLPISDFFAKVCNGKISDFLLLMEPQGPREYSTFNHQLLTKSIIFMSIKLHKEITRKSEHMLRHENFLTKWWYWNIYRCACATDRETHKKEMLTWEKRGYSYGERWLEGASWVKIMVVPWSCFERRFQPLWFFSNQQESITWCPRSPISKKKRKRKKKTQVRQLPELLLWTLVHTMHP